MEAITHHIRGIPEPLWRLAKAAANLEGRSLGEWVAEAIEAKIDRERPELRKRVNPEPTNSLQKGERQR